MIIKIKQIYHFLQRKIASIWLKINLQLRIVGITGSYGKTNTVYAISEILSSKYSINKTDQNLDTNFNLPITILKTKIWDEVLVMEYGVDHLGEMDNHLALIKLNIAVLTGITPVHTDKDHLGSLENVIKEKSKLINSLPEDGLAIFNCDDEIVRDIGEKYLKRKIYYGTSSKFDYWADNIQINIDFTKFVLHFKEREIKVLTGLLGYPAVYSSMVAFIVGKELLLKEEDILQKIRGLRPLSGRLSFEKGPLGTFLINDAKRANPASVISGIKSFSEFKGRKIAIIGEMGELGDSEVEMHKKIGEIVADLDIDLLIGVGPLAKNIIDTAIKKGLNKNKAFWAKNVKQAAEILKENIKTNDLIYLKGSLLKHMERIQIILENEIIKCDRVSCSRYSSCYTCPYLK